MCQERKVSKGLVEQLYDMEKHHLQTIHKDNQFTPYHYVSIDKNSDYVVWHKKIIRGFRLLRKGVLKL